MTYGWCCIHTIIFTCRKKNKKKKTNKCETIQTKKKKSILNLFFFFFFFFFSIKEGDNFIASFCLTWHINEVLFKFVMSSNSIAYDMIFTHSKRSFIIQVN